MRIVIDEDKCVAAGVCVQATPLVFDQREEDGVAFTLVEDVSEEHRESVRRAAAGCPASAIRIED